MTNYKKMYFILCRAADSVIEPLKNIPSAKAYAEELYTALLEAEEIYIDSFSDDDGKQTN